MGLRSLGAVLSLAGVAGFVAAYATGPQATPLFFTIESSIALVSGMALLGIGSFQHGYHRFAVGAPPGDMDMSKATDPNPPEASPPR